MLSFARRRFTFANVAMAIALVFAMSGGAYAASKVLITSTKQISPKVLKALRGKAGANGATGVAGPAGPAGPQGPAGATGPAGTAGAKGETGVEGKEGKTGKEGKAGLPGSPWTAGGTLPSGKTETGVWAFGPFPNKQGSFASVPVASFAIPLAAPLTSGHAHFINAAGKEINLEEEEVTSTACLGTAATPTAQPGNLCIYTSSLTNSVTNTADILSPDGSGKGASGRSGAIEEFAGLSSENEEGRGTWAVTAE